MNATTTTHPAHDHLSRFSRGLLPAEERQAVEAHVTTCDECTAQLTALDADSLAVLLRQGPELACPDATPMPATSGGLTAAFSAEETAADDCAIPEPLRDHPRYRVLRLIGRGGMGNVYLAEHRHMGRQVALKVIDPSLVSNPEAVRRFRQEVMAAARLSHPNVMQAHDAEEAGGLHFLVMEYVEGEHLAWHLAKAKLPYQTACEYARQAAVALQYAHDAGLVHRDVKPHNLMLTPDGKIKVLDFGLARMVVRPGAAGSGTEAGSLMGTPDYVAPEQARDAAKADGRADVYSLGCTLYHLLSGKVPFPGGSAVEKVARHLTEDVPALDEEALGLPPGLAEVVARMTARDVEKRYQTAGEVAAALAPFTSVEATPRRRNRTPWGWVAAVVGLVGFAALGVAGVVVHRIQTDKGELVIETMDEEVEVVVWQGGKQVRIIDTKTNKSVTLRLRSGEYEVETKGGEGSKIGVGEVTLKRDDKVIAKIKRIGIPHPIVSATKLQRFEWGEPWGLRDVSPDGRLVLIAAMPAKELRTYEVATGKFINRYGGSDHTQTQAAFSPDGKRIVFYTYWPDSMVRILDVESGKEVGRFREEVIYKGNRVSYATGAAFAPDGKTLFTCGEYGIVRQWDWEAGKEVRRFRRNQGNSMGLAVSPDGRHVACGSGNNPNVGPYGGICVWEVATGKLVRHFEGHATAGKEGESQLLFLPDGSRILSLGTDKTVRLWDVRTGKEVRRFEEKKHVFSSIGVSRDGRYLRSSGVDRTARLWDLETGEELQRQRFTDPSHGVTSCYVTPDGRFATFGVIDNVGHLWRLPEPPAPAPEKVGEVRRFQWESAVDLHAVSPDGSLVLARDKKDLVLWDLAQEKVVRRLKGHQGTIVSSGFSPDGKRIVSSSQWADDQWNDDSIRIWDVESGKELHVIRPAGHVYHATFSADGRHVFSCGERDGSVRMWDAQSGKEVKRFEGHRWLVAGLAVSPDGRYLVTAGRERPDLSVRVWDLKTGKEAQQLKGLTDNAHAITFLPDSRRLLVNTGPRGLRLFDVETGKEIRRYDFEDSQQGGVSFSSQCVSPDGRRFLTHGPGRTLRLWDVETGKVLHSFTDHTAAITSEVFMPDGKHALSGSQDNTMRLWRLPAPARPE